MYYEDMSNYCYYLKKPVSTVKNIGWLEKDRAYKKGIVSKKFMQNLVNIIQGNDLINAHVNEIRSYHPCNFCGCGDPITILSKANDVTLGASEIWIPSFSNDDVYFSSPSMVYHYIKDHGYLPPEDFIISVANFEFNKPYVAQDIYLSKIQGHF